MDEKGRFLYEVAICLKEYAADGGIEEIIAPIADRVEEYASENPDVTYDELVEIFGSPEDMLSELVEPTEMVDLEEKITMRRQRLRAAVILSACAVIVIAVAVFFIAKLTEKEAVLDGRYVEVLKQESPDVSLSTPVETVSGDGIFSHDTEPSFD